MDESRPRTAPDGQRTRGWSGVLARTAVAVLVLALIAAGVYLWRVRRGDQNRGAAQGGGGEPIAVTVVEVRPQDAPLAPRYIGRTEASQTVQIRARVSGFLEAREFEEGTTVEAGQVLFRIDRRPFEAALQVAQARLENARARLERARRQVERLQGAARQGAASETELDQQLTEEQVALSDVRLEEARVYQAQLDLSYTTIESPIRGLVGLAMRDVGSYVEAGGGDGAVLATVQRIDPIYAAYSISEQELLRWRRLIGSGQVRVPDINSVPLTVELSDGTVYPQEGRLNFVGTQVETTTATTLLRGEVPNPEYRLLPGEFVHVSPRGTVRTGALLVPLAAVLQTAAGASVYVVGADGTAQARPVVLGDWVGQAVIIEEGLAPGDRVIVDRVAQIRPGTRVSVAEVRPPPAPGPADAAPAHPAPPPLPRPGSGSGTPAAPAAPSPS